MPGPTMLSRYCLANGYREWFALDDRGILYTTLRYVRSPEAYNKQAALLLMNELSQPE